jgi:oligopeptide transport system substrate-binding protein
MRKSFLKYLSFAVLLALVISACQPTAEPETIVQTVIVEGEVQEIVVTATPEAAPMEKKELFLNFGPGDIPTLDPSLGTDTSSIQIAIETFVGLTRLDEVTNVVQPGMAYEWDLDETETIYTFYIKEDVPWVRYDSLTASVVNVLDCEGNPRYVNANDFYYGITRTLAPETASDYAYVLGMAIVGAADYNAGLVESLEEVGVRVIDDYTIEMTFLEPAAYNAAIAGMWVAYAEPSWLIDGDDCTEARGDRWTETGFFQGYGPYVMKEWVHDSFITLVRNDLWPATDNIPMPKIEEVTWYMLDQSPAFAEYEAGNIDVTDAPLADMDRIKADPTLSAELTINPFFCTYYYGYNTTAPFVDDVRVRRALSLALDRQSLIDNVTKGEQQPAQWFSRPGLAGSPIIDSHPDLGVKYDPEQAKAVLQEYLDEEGLTAGDLDITLMFNTSEGHRKIAEAIQAMWSNVLGLNVQLVNQEWKVFLETTKSPDTPQIYRSGWCQDYPDANNFIREVFALGGSQNPSDPEDPTLPYGGAIWYNEAFEAKVLEAARELDPDTRVDLYAEAEDILVWQDAVIIPIYWYTTVEVTKPYVTRTYASGGQEYIEKWDVDMNAK